MSMQTAEDICIRCDTGEDMVICPELEYVAAGPYQNRTVKLITG